MCHVFPGFPGLGIQLDPLSSALSSLTSRAQFLTAQSYKDDISNHTLWRLPGSNNEIRSPTHAMNKQLLSLEAPTCARLRVHLLMESHPHFYLPVLADSPSALAHLQRCLNVTRSLQRLPEEITPLNSSCVFRNSLREANEARRVSLSVFVSLLLSLLLEMS